MDGRDFSGLNEFGQNSFPNSTLTAEEINAGMVQAYHWLGLGMNEPTRSPNVDDVAGNHTPDLDNLAETMRRWGIGF